MIYKKYFFSFIIILFAPFYSSAYYLFDQTLEQSYSKILTFHFNEAEKLLQQEKTEKPGNDLIHLYKNYIFFLKAFVSEEKQDYELLLKHASVTLEEIKTSKENVASPLHLFVQSEIYVQLAMVKIKFGDNISAANDMRKAYKLIHRNEELFPNFLLNKKISGLLNVLIGSVPEKYQWLLNYAGINGKINEGILQLQTLYDSTEENGLSSYRPEILFYQGFIYSVLSIQSDSSNLMTKMKPLVKSYPLIAYVYTNILMKQGRNDEAIETFDSALLNGSPYAFIFFYYKRGLARLRKMDLEAKSDFDFYLKNYKGINNIKSTYQKLAWIALLKGDTAGYHSYLLQCKQHGNTILDEDKNAAEESNSNELQNVYLLKSRLLFDGGYYNEAISTITSHPLDDFPSYNDRLEVTYRLGRILQMKGQIEKAILYFEKTLKNGLSSKRYFAANSSLMLGQIYEEKGEFERATSYYKQTIEIKSDEYKNSMDQKAKAGLERIKMKSKIE
jgi:tetratricopeptide (TPR) repeat protein